MVFEIFGLLYGQPGPIEWHWHFLAKLNRITGIVIALYWLWLVYDAYWG